ncbi:TPA: hypothetical protein U2L35_004335 [Burkholderia cenocepacia]|nr:hypothetical protein [Burkholderia cenocepacia]
MELPEMGGRVRLQRATSTHRAAPAGAGSEFIMEGTRVGALKKQRWPDEISFRKRWSPTADDAARFLKNF